MTTTPPHNLEAEQAVLGAILIDNEAFYRVAFLEPGHRLSQQHRGRCGPLPGERAGVVVALVHGHPPRQVTSTVDPRCRADVGLDDEGPRTR